MPSSAVDVNNFRVLIHNETSKDLSIPVGTVVAHVFPTVAHDIPESKGPLNPELFNFGEAPIPAG